MAALNLDYYGFQVLGRSTALRDLEIGRLFRLFCFILEATLH